MSAVNLGGLPNVPETQESSTCELSLPHGASSVPAGATVPLEMLGKQGALPSKKKKMEMGAGASTVVGSTAALQQRIKDLAELKLERWKESDELLRAPSQDTNYHTKIPSMKQGQIEFSGIKGHRAHYLITPPEMEEPEKVLMHMFDDKSQLGWKLKPPNLVLYSLGGRDHYMHWINSSQSGPEVWGTDDHLRRSRFRSRMTEIAGGVCQAVTECGGWFDFGAGGRGGMSEVLKDGLKAHWATKGHLAGVKTDTVVFAVRMLKTAMFHEDFEANAVDLAIGAEAAPDRLKKRVVYPSVDHFLFPEHGGKQVDQPRAGHEDENPDHDLEGFEEVQEQAALRTEKRLQHELVELAGDTKALDEVNFKLNNQFLSNCLTHIIFVQNEQLLQKLGKALRDLTTRAVIFANGRPDLIYPGIEGHVLNAAAAGTPVVILHHTGGAAEKLGYALQQKRSSIPPQEGKYQIPENVNVDNFLLLSTSSDSVEKVIDKLTLVLSSTQDDEMREVGYLQAEKSRLLQAWHLHALFRHHARLQRARARRLYFSMLFLSFMTTCIAVFESAVQLEAIHTYPDGSEYIPDGWKWGFEPLDLPVKISTIMLLLTLIPLVTAVVQSVFSRFNPLSKYASFEMAALRVRTEIYMYRARTLEYKPRNRNDLDIMKQIQRVQEAENQLAMRKYKEASTDGFVEEDLQGLNKEGTADEARGMGKAETRRKIFAENLDKIHSEATMSDVGSTSLHPPDEATYQSIIDSLFGNKQHDSKQLPQDMLSQFMLDKDKKLAADMKQAMLSDGPSRQRRSSVRARGWFSKEPKDSSLPIRRAPKERMAFRHTKSPLKRTSSCAATPIYDTQDNNSSQVDSSIFDPRNMNVLRDDGFALVTAEDYVTFRLKPQILLYQELSPYLNKMSGRLQVASYTLTAITTGLALIGYSYLVPIPVALMSALMSIADFEQLSVRLRNVNQCKMQLDNLQIWWESLSMVEKRLPVNKEYLVKVTEENVNAEVSAFIKSTTRQGKPQAEEEMEEKQKLKTQKEM